MKRLISVLFLCLFAVPLHSQSRLFVRSNSDKLTNSNGIVQRRSWTLSVWINLASLPSSGQQYEIFCDGSGWGRPNPRFNYLNESGTKKIYLADSSTFGNYNESRYNVDLNTNQWYHLCVTAGNASGSNAVKLYIDGVNYAWTSGGTYQDQQNHGGTIGIGVLRWDSDVNFFDGKIAEVARWCGGPSLNSTIGELSPNEVLALSRGVPARKIRPSIEQDVANARRYIWSLRGLNSPEYDLVNRYAATVTGTSRANGPPIMF